MLGAKYRIARSVREAVQFMQSVHGSEQIHYSMHSKHPAMVADHADGAAVRSALGSREKAKRNIILVDTHEELKYAMLRFVQEMGWPLLADLQAMIDHNAEHERQHAVAATKMGIKSVSYGLLISRQAHGLIYTPFTNFAVSRQMTKLQLAAIFAMPETLSSDDQHILTSMGYQTMDELISRIRQHNAASASNTIPLPLSYSAS